MADHEEFIIINDQFKDIVEVHKFADLRNSGGANGGGTLNCSMEMTWRSAFFPGNNSCNFPRRAESSEMTMSCSETSLILTF